MASSVTFPETESAINTSIQDSMNLAISTQTAQTIAKLKISPDMTKSDEKGVAQTDLSTCLISKGSQGMTLVEMLIAIGVGSLVLMIMAAVFMMSARSFAATSNYVHMDANSRMALDHLTKDIRQAGDLTEFTPTRLKFSRFPQTNSFLVYSWDSTTRQLIGSSSDSAATTTFLTGCDQLVFSLYDSAFAPTTNIARSKGIRVSWNCSGTVLGNQTSEEMQQATIIMRNKKF
jgi:prepilin-type N-terminal cleavage/methylation domain-containing protein